MKKVLKVVLLVCVLLFLSASMVSVVSPSFTNAETSSTPAVTSASNSTIVVNTTLPAVPSYAYTLKILPKRITKSQALLIAERMFNMSGEAYSWGGSNWQGWEIDWQGWKVVDGEQTLRVLPDGVVEYQRYPESREFPRSAIPPDERCLEIAELFIEEFKAEGFLPSSLDLDPSYREVGPSGGGGTLWPNGTSSAYVEDVSVRFRYSYASIIMNKGLRVAIGANGEIIGFRGSLNEVKPLEKLSIGSPEWAIEKLEEKIQEGKAPRGINIKSIELVYMVPVHPDRYANVTLNPIIEGELFVPTYYIDGVYKNMRWVEYIPATVEVLEVIGAKTSTFVFLAATIGTGAAVTLTTMTLIASPNARKKLKKILRIE